MRYNGPEKTDPPPRKSRSLGVTVPPPKSRPTTHGTHHSARSSDVWGNRIWAASALVGALSAAGFAWPKSATGQQVERLSEKLTALSERLDKMDPKVEQCGTQLDGFLQENKRLDQAIEGANLAAVTQSKQLKDHAHVIYLLNGRVRPMRGWPETWDDDWISGTDNLHRHVAKRRMYAGADKR